MDKKEFRMLIKHYFLIGKNTVEAKQWLDKCYGDSVSGKSTIIDWYDEFKRSRTNTDDAETKKIVNWMDNSLWKPSKASKNSTVG